MANVPLKLVVIDKEGDKSELEIDPQPLTEGGEGVIFRSVDGANIIKMYRPSINRKVESMFEILEAAPDKGQPEADLLAWPTHLVPMEGGRVGGVVVPNASQTRWMKQLIWYTSHSKWNSLEKEYRSNFQGMLKVATDIASALRFLNLTGYGHADLSGRNILCNPIDGRAVVIDLDGLVVPNHMTGDVVGTPGYMAPELVDGWMSGNHVYPSAITDRHALAVLLFEMFLWQHPLLGGTRKPLHDDPQVDDLLQTSTLHAIYIHHPTDLSNRPRRPFIPVESMGSEIAGLFERAFVDGIRVPEARPHPSEWEDALHRLQKDLTKCRNSQCFWVYFPSRAGHVTTCPICNSESVPEPIGRMKVIPQTRPGFYSKSQAKKSIELLRQHMLTRKQVFGSKIAHASQNLLQLSYEGNSWTLNVADDSAEIEVIEANNQRRRKLKKDEKYPVTRYTMILVGLGDNRCILHLDK